MLQTACGYLCGLISVQCNFVYNYLDNLRMQLLVQSLVTNMSVHGCAMCECKLVVHHDMYAVFNGIAISS